MFTLKQLRSFVVVAEECNLSRAATRLHVSQPALSRRIQELERGLGLQLFEQVGRSIKLSGPGAAFLGQCRDVLAHSKALEEHVAALAAGDAGLLRVGASPPVLELLFPQVVHRYRKLFPQVDLQLVENANIDVLAELERGEVHLAVTSFPIGDQFEVRLLTTIPILAAGARRNPLGRAGAVEVETLAHEPLLQLRRGFFTRDTFDAACHLAHVEPRTVLESAVPQTLLALAEADFGVAVVPSTVRLDHYEVRASTVTRAGKPLEKRLSIVWARGRQLPRYAERFIEEVSSCAHERFSADAIAGLDAVV